ncbi:MAG: carboxypeptidase-like regulatory domain-containing protein [Terriglobia bacterium]
MKNLKKTKKANPSAVFWLALVALSFTLGLAAHAKEKSPKRPRAILAGSVHDEIGFALPGIRIEIRRQGEKKAKWKAVSDARGEFAVRVPAGPATYIVATASKKHRNQQKTVKIVSHERAAVLFRLSPRQGGKP